MVESIVEKCIEQVSNRFKLALLASQRTHDLNTGAGNPNQAVKLKNHKNTIVSLCEIAEKKVDTHELFNLLVGRCKEYTKGNASNTYSNNVDKLEKLLNFSNAQFNITEESEEGEESIDIQNDEMDDQDGEEE